MQHYSNAHIVSLVHQAQAGDHEAFTELYSRYEAFVFRTAYLILGNGDQATDITQEVFVRVYAQLRSYAPDRGAFATWLHRITVNACRKQRRRLIWDSLERLVGTAREPAASAPHPLDRVLQSEEHKAVWHAIQALPFKLRVPIVLRYYLHLSYAEMAEVLDCPIGTVRSRLHHAHRHLRTVLREALTPEGVNDVDTSEFPKR